MKEIIELLSASLAPITAIVALGIAYRQYRLEQLKFRRELYEKRLAIYNSTMKLLAIVMREGNVEMSDLIQFIQETNQSYFLLGKDVSEYLTEIYKKGVEVNYQNRKLNDRVKPVVGEERSQLADKNCQLLIWFGDQLVKAPEKFAIHMRLDK